MTLIKRPVRMSLKGKLTRPIGLVLGAIVFVLPYVVQLEGLSVAGHRIFSVFLLAIVLWVTEAIPLHATAALIILLEILLISDKALSALPAGFEAPAFSTFFAALAHPVLMLFLGGFFLADGAAKFRLDKNMARVLLHPFGDSPRRIMLGLMLITAMFSMFMSNTATTATMLAVVLPVIATLEPGDRLRTGLALAIPVAANIGGIGTPVGTPPNAIAVGSLADAGISISFVQWMVMAVPMMLVILLIAWYVLVRLFPAQKKVLKLKIDATFDTSLPAKVFYATFALTVGLWMTEPLHGISSYIVGFLPVVILLSTRVFSTRDLQSIQWHVLWLVAGGIALGIGVNASGLDLWLVGLVGWESIRPALLILTLAVIALLLSTFISNSAAANLLIPIGLSLALSDAVAGQPALAAFFIAVGSSLAMALPVSTPPNAIAFSTGAVTTRDMAVAGSIIGVVGLVIYVFVAPLLWDVMGVAL
ncbi:MAG: SLC13 family permease [Acidimicrobiia bacterium]